MYVDKEALGCQAGQLSELHAEPQHLSDWLVEEESCLCVHLCGGGHSMCVKVKVRLLMVVCVCLCF